METQCWICPDCFDDHAIGKECEARNLKVTITELRMCLENSKAASAAEIERLRGAVEAAMDTTK